MDEVLTIINKVMECLKTVGGVDAIVLGGSRARGTDTAGSDIDIGIYYKSETLLDMPALQEASQSLDDGHGYGLVAAPGEWGAWVNGGGWLTVDRKPTDLILRDLVRVEKAVRDCQCGSITAHYQPGHPHAYLNAMYRGELAVCRILWDRTGDATALQASARPYPPLMKSAMLSFFGFEAGFSCALAKKYAEQGDTYYVTSHIVRAISCLNQALFARNEQYCLNEKKAVGMIDAFPVRPEGYKSRVDGVFLQSGANPAEACRLLEGLVREVDMISRG